MFLIVPSRSRDSFVIYATAVFLPIRLVNACMCIETYHDTDAFVSVTSKTYKILGSLASTQSGFRTLGSRTLRDSWQLAVLSLGKASLYKRDAFSHLPQRNPQGCQPNIVGNNPTHYIKVGLPRLTLIQWVGLILLIRICLFFYVNRTVFSIN